MIRNPNLNPMKKIVLFFIAAAACTAQSQVSELALIGHMGQGRSYAVAQDYPLLCYGNGANLEILDGSNPENPTIRSVVTTPGLINRIRLVDGKAYIANGNFGFSIIDLSDPDNPQWISNYITGGVANDVEVTSDSHYAVLADGTNGIVVIDIEDPTAPVEAGHFIPEGIALGVELSEDYIWAACQSGGIYVLDMSDPSNITQIAHTLTSQYAWDIKVSGLYAYVADFGGGLRVLQLLGSIFEEVGALGSFGSCIRLELGGATNQTVFMANINFGLWIIDVSNPEIPEAITYCQTENARDVSVTDQYAYIADLNQGLKVIDITNLELPEIKASRGCLGLMRDFNVMGQMGLGATLTRGLVTFDISMPFDPTLQGYYDQAGGAYNVAWSENYLGKLAYLCNMGNGLNIISIDNPSSPVFLGNWDPSPNSASGVGVAVETYGMVYLATGGSVQALDITNPYNISLKSELFLPGFVESVEVVPDNEQMLFVACNAQGVARVIFNGALGLELLGWIPTGGQVRFIEIQGNYLFIADCSDGVGIYDISNVFNPVLKSTIPTNGCANDVAASGDHLYIADFENGIYAWDISDPSIPQYLCSYRTGANPYRITSRNDTVYVADGEDGYFVLKLNTVPDADSDGVSDAKEQGPDGNDPAYDGNNDGTPDWQQSNVVSIHSFNGIYYLTYSVEGAVFTAFETYAPPAGAPAEYDFSYGLFYFMISLPAKASSEPLVNMYLPQGESAASYFNYGLSPELRSDEWYEFMWDGATGGEINGNVITLHYTDGQRGDHDGQINGFITTKGGPAIEKQGIHEDNEIFINMSCYPNPATDKIFLEFTLESPQWVSITFMDIYGRAINTRPSEYLAKGRHVLAIDVGAFSIGVYLARVEAGHVNKSIRVLVR